mgnify:FL=1
MDSDLTSLLAKRVRYQRLLAVSPFEIGISTLARRALNSLLRLAAIAFRTLFPHKKDNTELSQVFLSNTKDFRIATKWIRGNERFEHILFGSSSSYLKARTEIAQKAYEVDSGQILYKVKDSSIENQWEKLLPKNLIFSSQPKEKIVNL